MEYRDRHDMNRNERNRPCGQMRMWTLDGFGQLCILAQSIGIFIAHQYICALSLKTDLAAMHAERRQCPNPYLQYGKELFAS